MKLNGWGGWTPFEILNVLAVLVALILVYVWLDEIQALVGRPFG